MFWREIEFEKINNKLPKSLEQYFMKMYKYSVTKCDYQHQPNWVDARVRRLY